jgi:hypothetical protein
MIGKAERIGSLRAFAILPEQATRERGAGSLPPPMILRMPLRKRSSACSFFPTRFRANYTTALAEHTVTAVKEYVRLLIAARHIHRGAPREDLQAFFDLLDRQHEMEHATDDAERQVFTVLMRENPEAKLLIVATTVAEALEKAGDALLRTSRLVADHALGEWLAA